MARQYPLYVDVSSKITYDAEGDQLNNRNLPYIYAKEEIELLIQYVQKWTSPTDFDPYLGFVGIDVSSSAVVDNDFNKVDKGSLVGALTGAITSIEISGLDNIPQPTGFVQLINDGGESETVEYTAVTSNGSNYVFTVSTTLTYSYQNGDQANANDPALIKSDDSKIDNTDKDTGLFKILLDADSAPYLFEIEGSERITNCKFEHKVSDTRPKPIFVAQFDFDCLNTLDDDGVIPPPEGGDYYTKIEVDALLAGKMDLNADNVVSGTPLVATDEVIAYDPVTGTTKKRPVSEVATGSQTPPVQNEYVDIPAMLADQGSQATNYLQQAGADFYKKKAISTADISDYDQIGGGDSNIPPVQNSYADTTAMIAGQGDQTAQYIQRAGANYYEYLGTTVGDITDYQQIGGASGGISSVVAGLNIDVDNADPSNPIVSTENSVEFDDITLGSANVRYNSDFDLVEYSTSTGDIVKIGLDSAFVFYNDTGAEIPAGRVLHLVAVSTASGYILPTFEIADASDWAKCQGTLIFTCCAIPNASVGIGLTKGQADGVDTTGFAAPAQVWLPADGTGIPTTTKPTFPDFSISVGGVANAQADGTFVVNFTTSITDIFNDAWNGSFVESFDFLIASNGSTITGTLQNINPARNMTMNFSSGFATLDTTAAPLTIDLTAGTDSTPQKNYVYIPESTKVLTLSTVGWPTGTEHIKISDSFVKTATTTQTDGVLVNRNWNDHIKDEGDNGHILHIAENLRSKNADWLSGAEGSVTVTGGSEIDIAVTGGKVSQLHEQTFSAFDTSVGDKLEVVNDFTSPYLATADLEDVTTDSAGGSLTNTSYKVVIWGVQNKTGQNDKVMVNMPSGTYAKNVPDNAVNDSDSYANYSFPEIFKGKGFLIKEATFVNNGGTISLYAEKDLRGKTPNTVSGGGGGGGTGATTYLALTDTDNSYTGQAGKVPVVNPTETALEFENIVSLQPTKTSTTGNQTFVEADFSTIRENTDSLDVVFTIPDTVGNNALFSYKRAIGAGNITVKNTTGNTIISTTNDQAITESLLFGEVDGFYIPWR